MKDELNFIKLNLNSHLVMIGVSRVDKSDSNPESAEFGDKTFGMAPPF